jgi:hypothetical protein
LRRGTGARTMPVYNLFKFAATWRTDNSPERRAKPREGFERASSLRASA